MLALEIQPLSINAYRKKNYLITHNNPLYDTWDRWDQLDYKGQQHHVAYVAALLAPISQKLALMLHVAMFTLPKQSQMF